MSDLNPSITSIDENTILNMELPEAPPSSPKECPPEPEKLIVKEEKSKLGVVGLNNMGNTCYLNAVIQILSNLDDFRKFIISGEFIGKLRGELDDSLFYQVHRIIKSLWETTADSLTPTSLRKKFVEKQKLFMGFEQHDSHEALQFMIDNLHEEIQNEINLNITLPDDLKEFFDFCDKYYNNEAKDPAMLKLIDENKDKALDYFAMRYYKNLAKKYSQISDFFQSITCNLTKCPDCNHVNFDFENNYMLSLSFPDLEDDVIKKMDEYKKMFDEKKEELKEKINDDEMISKLCLNDIRNKFIFKLSDILNTLQRVEQLDEKNLWHCDGCNKKVQAIKQCKIFKNPKYLIIHLKRFKHITHNGNTFVVKVKNLVAYENEIDIQPLMIRGNDHTKYVLKGGVNHLGEVDGGHYTCFAKNNNKWYNYNDNRVNEIDCSVPITQHAYMLIYERID